MIYENSKTFLPNLASNIGVFAAGTLIALWFTPYLIKHLSMAVYGLVPLALTITAYFNLLTIGLNTAVGRYMTIALEQSDYQQANIIFNSSFWMSLIIALLLVPLGAILCFCLDHWIRIPAGYEHQTRILFICTIAAFLVTTVGSSFSNVCFCRNRLDLQNIATFMGNITKVLAVIVLFQFFSPDLWQVGAGIAAAAIVTFIVSVGVCYYLWPNLEINIGYFNARDFKEMGAMGAWSLIGQIGTVLLVAIDLIVANKLFGPEQSGRYAAVLQWSLSLRGFAMVTAGVFVPTVISYYAQNRIQEMADYSKRAVKLMGLIVSLPVALICGFSESLLSVWLGPGFASLSILMIILTGHLALNLAYLPLHGIFVATNKIQWPSISQLMAGVFNIGLAVVLGKHFHLYGIALAGAAVLLIKNIIFTPVYAAHVIKKPLGTFLNEVLPITLLTMAVGLLSFCVDRLYRIDSWAELIFAGAVVSLAHLLCAWHFVLDDKDKATLKRLLGEINVRKKLH